jgi:predicted transcriptional regulator
VHNYGSNMIDLGPVSIRTISRSAGITHSAVSQTASQMAKQGLVSLKASSDARERVSMTAHRAWIARCLGRHRGGGALRP